MILLDTYAVIRIASGQRIRPTAVARLEAARETDSVIGVSTITAWELCMLGRAPRSGPVIGGNGAAFFRDAVHEMRLQVIPIDADVAIAAASLPELDHRDPADRFIIATARLRDLSVVTSDRVILDYGARGHVRVIPC